MTRQDINQAAAADLVPLRRQRRLYRGAAGEVREGPVLGRGRLARLLRRAGRRSRRASTRPREGASWQRPNWPIAPKDELTNALDGDWPATEKAIGDKMRARAAAAPKRRRATTRSIAPPATACAR